MKLSVEDVLTRAEALYRQLTACPVSLLSLSKFSKHLLFFFQEIIVLALPAWPSPPPHPYDSTSTPHLASWTSFPSRSCHTMCRKSWGWHSQKSPVAHLLPYPRCRCPLGPRCPQGRRGRMWLRSLTAAWRSCLRTTTVQTPSRLAGPEAHGGRRPGAGDVKPAHEVEGGSSWRSRSPRSRPPTSCQCEAINCLLSFD